MGIFKAASGAIGGTLSDQWLERYYCNSIPDGILAVKGKKQVSENSANTKGDPNIISKGSVISVNEGQCAFVIELGKVIGFYDTPGENIFGSEKSSGIFSGGGLKSIGKQTASRIGFGGDAAIHQSVIYLDLKEKLNNAFSVDVPVNFKDDITGINMDAKVSVSGKFSYRIENPLVFYKRICRNSANTLCCDSVLPQLSAELREALMLAFNGLCKRGIMPHDLPAHTGEIDSEIKNEMTEEWINLRGFSVISVAIDSIVADKEDMSNLKRYERGAAVALGMGITGNTSSQTENKPVSGNKPSLWYCSCGKMNTSNFCENCGRKRG